MKINDFIENFVDALEIESCDNLTAETAFKELDEWDSLGALTLIAMIDAEYSITITNKHLRDVNTMQELFELVQSLS